MLMPPTLTQNVDRHVLANGLTILTKEVHSAPVVTVQVWYQVGSAQETAFLSGISHQLEHLMFKGTHQRPLQFGRLFSALGSDSNAFTSYDQTAYFNTVERSQLRSLLELEADRMHQLLLDPAQIATEKGVVISELQGYENDPSYRLDRAVMQRVFPTSAYGLSIGGTPETVAAFTPEQIKQYYQTYYCPSRATLVIVGDFDTEPTLQQVSELFASIANPIESVDRQSQLPAVELSPQAILNDPIQLEEPGSNALLEVVYPLPALQHPDVPALLLLDLILTEGRNSRLELALIDSGLASQISSYPATMRQSGWYTLWATAVPGQALADIEQALQTTLRQVQTEGVSQQELQRAQHQFLADVVLLNRDITSQGMLLGHDHSTTGDYQFSDRGLKAICAVTVADVQQVAQRYLLPEARTVGFFLPTELEGEESPMLGQAQHTIEDFGASEPVNLDDVVQYLPSLVASPQWQGVQLPEVLWLDNGLQVLLLQDTSTPTVTLSGHLRAGSEFDRLETAGLASLTADNLLSGTVQRDAYSLAQILDDCGASLEFNPNREGVMIAANAMSPDLPILLDVLADVLQQATFPASEVVLSQQQALADLAMNLDDPSRLGRRLFQQAVYPIDHPFHAFPTEQSLKAITRTDLEDFYRAYYQPQLMILSLVGDFELQTAQEFLQKTLGQWQPGSAVPQLPVKTVDCSQSVTLHHVLAGKSQSVTYLGHLGIARQDPQFCAALVLNYLLGGDTLASRLGTELRDRLGLTYGVYSYFQPGLYPGPFVIEMQTAPEMVQPAISNTLTILKQLQTDGVTDSEFKAAQRSIMRSYPVELAHPETLASAFLMNAVYGLPVQEIQDFPRQLQDLTLEQVNTAARSLLHPDQLSIVTVGP
jgi:zinc protease